MVTVDGTHGRVLAGRAVGGAQTEPVATAVVAAPASEVTATKIYVNVAMPDKAEQAAALDVDGVGLLRAELILEDALGNRHPRDLIEHGEQESLVDSLATAVGRVAAAFARARWSIGPRTSAPTSSATCRAATSTSPKSTTR